MNSKSQKLIKKKEARRFHLTSLNNQTPKIFIARSLWRNPVRSLLF
jgi:hypothetical protein